MFYQSQRNVTKSVIKETIIPIWIRAFLSPLIWLKNIVFYLSGFLSVTVIGIYFLYLNEMGDGDTGSTERGMILLWSHKHGEVRNHCTT